jgi:hypothetical protein
VSGFEVNLVFSMPKNANKFNRKTRRRRRDEQRTRIEKEIGSIIKPAVFLQY